MCSERPARPSPRRSAARGAGPSRNRPCRRRRWARGDPHAGRRTGRPWDALAVEDEGIAPADGAFHRFEIQRPTDRSRVDVGDDGLQFRGDPPGTDHVVRPRRAGLFVRPADHVEAQVDDDVGCGNRRGVEEVFRPGHARLFAREKAEKRRPAQRSGGHSLSDLDHPGTAAGVVVGAVADKASRGREVIEVGDDRHDLVRERGIGARHQAG